MRLSTPSWLIVIAVSSLAFFFIFANLGDRLLWQDEAEVAFLGKTISEQGRPLAWDGRNIMTQQSGTEFDNQFVWHWSAWGTLFLASLGERFFGPTPFGFRFPSAVFGFLAFLISFAVARRWFERESTVIAVFVAQLFSIPFFLFMRQCRYYSMVAFLGLIVLWLYPRLPRWSAALGLAVASAGIAYFNELSLVLLGVPLFLYAALMDDNRYRWKRLLQIAPLIILIAMPQVLIHFGGEHEGQAWRSLSFGLLGLRFLKGWYEWNSVVVPFLLLIPLWIFRRRFSSGTNRLTRLLTCFAFIGPLSVAPFLDPNISYAPYAFSLGMMLIGSFLVDCWRMNRKLATVSAILLLGTNLVSIGPIIQRGAWIKSELVGFMKELVTHYRGPTEAIVEFLHTHAEKNDVVLATYEQLQLMLHTDLKIAFLVPPNRGRELHLPSYTYDPLAADWFIPRMTTCVDCPPLNAPRFLKAVEACGAKVKAFPLGVEDLKYGNSPNINTHAFESPPPNKNELIVYRLTRPTDAIRFEQCVRKQGGIGDPS